MTAVSSSSARSRICPTTSPHKRLAALYTEDGAHLCGAAIVNWPRALVECRRALKAAALLTDVETTLVAAHRTAGAADKVKAPR